MVDFTDASNDVVDINTIGNAVISYCQARSGAFFNVVNLSIGQDIPRHTVDLRLPYTPIARD